MKKHRLIILMFLIVSLIFVLDSCRKDHFWISPPPAPPKVGIATSTLEANPVTTVPNKIASAYWKTADYLKVNVKDVSTGLLYGDGLLNMTGLFGGKSNFSGGDPNLTLKAAYDDNNLYILAEWNDTKLNFSNASWLWNGSADPLKSSESSDEWTSQRNNDKLGFVFEVESASSSFGSFNTVGCQASCHGSGSATSMYPDNGKVDIWNWNTAISNPLGYAQDMVADANGFKNDAGDSMYARNITGLTDRSGPAFEWDGNSQNVTLGNGSPSLLNPAFFLLSKTPFIGDAHRGDSLYRVVPPGKVHGCDGCHGAHGEGESDQAINTLSINQKSRSSLISALAKDPMDSYITTFSSSDIDDILAYVRGLAGVPGYYLTNPSGSNADIIAVTNITPIDINNSMLPSTNKHTKYQVLIIRKLKTGNNDDVQFDLSTSKTFKFGIALMDNDGKNHIGSPIETLTFK